MSEKSRGVIAIGGDSQNGTTVTQFLFGGAVWLTEIGHKDYCSRKAGLKKEIPVRAPFTGGYSFLETRSEEQNGQIILYP